MSRDGKRMVMWSLVSSSQRTCTPDSFALVVRSTLTPPPANPPQHYETARTPQNQEYTMTDNPTYRGGQGQGRPDDYYDDRYGRPEDREGGQDPRGQNPPGPAGLPAAGRARLRPARQGGTPSRAATRSRAATPTRRLPRPGRLPAAAHEQRPPAGYGPPPGGGYPDQGYRQPPGGYPPPGGQPGYGGRRLRPSAAPRPRQEDYGRQRTAGRPIPNRAAIPGTGRRLPGSGRLRRPGLRRQQYGRQEYAQPDYGRYGEPPACGGTPNRDTASPPAVGTTTVPLPARAGAGYGGYGQGDYPPGGATVTLQLDDGSGRTYQLREGANVIGRGQDAQFRLPDTGVSRRHLEIRWDGQVALLADLNSTNGTTVNNAPVQEWQLADGDVIRLGHSEIIVRVH